MKLDDYRNIYNQTNCQSAMKKELPNGAFIKGRGHVRKNRT